MLRIWQKLSWGNRLVGKTEGDLTKRIETAVKRGRLNSIWRAEYMKELAFLQDVKDEGIEIGVERGMIVSYDR